MMMMSGSGVTLRLPSSVALSRRCSDESVLGMRDVTEAATDSLELSRCIITKTVDKSAKVSRGSYTSVSRHNTISARAPICSPTSAVTATTEPQRLDKCCLLCCRSTDKPPAGL
jgi:hypothetical protein